MLDRGTGAAGVRRDGDLREQEYADQRTSDQRGRGTGESHGRMVCPS